jgi:hypothetical protein
LRFGTIGITADWCSIAPESLGFNRTPAADKSGRKARSRYSRFATVREEPRKSSGDANEKQITV